MLARGFDGRVRMLRTERFGAGDAVFLASAVMGMAALRVLAGVEA
jgi:hypothetical protein